MPVNFGLRFKQPQLADYAMLSLVQMICDRSGIACYYFSVKEFSKTKQSVRSSMVDVKFLVWSIKTLWEQSAKAKAVKIDNERKNLKPMAVVHIDANILPEDLTAHLDAPMFSKIKMIYTGPTPMSHEDENDIIDQMFKDAKALSQYLPILYRCVFKMVQGKLIQSSKPFQAEHFKP